MHDGGQAVSLAVHSRQLLNSSFCLYIPIPHIRELIVSMATSTTRVSYPKFPLHSISSFLLHFFYAVFIDTTSAVMCIACIRTMSPWSNFILIHNIPCLPRLKISTWDHKVIQLIDVPIISSLRPGSKDFFYSILPTLKLYMWLILSLYLSVLKMGYMSAGNILN